MTYRLALQNIFDCCICYISLHMDNCVSDNNTNQGELTPAKYLDESLLQLNELESTWNSTKQKASHSTHIPQRMPQWSFSCGF